MGAHSVEILKSAVIILGLSTLGSALGIYLLMEIHFRRQMARHARRVILESRLSPAPAEKDPEVFWSGSSRRDQGIILDILVDQATSSEANWQNAIKQTLMGLGVFDRWVDQLRYGSVEERVDAATRLGSFRDPRGVAALVGAAEDASWQVRLAMALALGKLKDPAGVRGLVRVAQNPVRPVPDLTLAAALAACAEGKPALLADLLHSPEPRLRIMASWALSEVADASVLEPLLGVACDPDPEVRAKSARALARIHNRESVAALTRLAKDPVWFVRVRALDALGELHDQAGEEAALRGLEDPIPEVRSRAALALGQIRGMKSEVVANVLATISRRGFNSLISEWDRAGFLWEAVKGLSTRDWERYQESLRTLRILIGAGTTRALAHFILVFPDLKVRLRLVRLFLESRSSRVRAEIHAVTKVPVCHRLVAQKIAQTFPSAVRVHRIAPRAVKVQ
jgi:HEAT repeat protein